ncbi:hypothetical protein MTO96_009143 [Rhipicephalus appendiculatus]
MLIADTNMERDLDLTLEVGSERKRVTTAIGLVTPTVDTHDAFGAGGLAEKILSAVGGEHALGRSGAPPLTWGPGPSAVMVLADRVKSWRRVILAARRHPAGRGGAAIVAAVRWTRSRPETLTGGAGVRMRRDRAGVVDRHWRRCVSHG